MSELMNVRSNGRGLRWQLLSTVSAVALLAAVYGPSDSRAADQDADRPTVWIELGGQMEHINGQGDAFVPGFLAANPNSSVLQPVTPVQAQRPGPFSFAEEGKISIQPDGSDWVFSVGVNYGRSSNFKHVDHQTNGVHAKYSHSKPGQLITDADFADTQAHRQESHAILDFVAGKDVGLGMFGKEGSSTLSFGVRFAQFASKATFDIRARPDLRIKYYPSAHALPSRDPLKYFHTYHAAGQASRSFHGIGPSLSWNGSIPFAGNQQNGEVTFDWGANAAALFGRQKAHVRHQETAHYENWRYIIAGNQTNYHLVYQRTGGHDTDRSIIVPNVGGFAGASFRIENFKVSFGYRADFFFGAIDGGIDTRKSETLGFYGPFTTINVGLGG